MAGSRLRVLGVGTDVSVTAVLHGGAALLGFAFQAILLRNLSKEDAGTYFLAIAAAMVAGGLADFGIAATILPRISILSNSSSPTFRAALNLRALSLAISGILLFGFLLFTGTTLPTAVGLAAFGSILFSAKGTGIRQLYELIWRLRGRTYVVGALSMFDMVLGVIALIVLAWAGELTLLTAALVAGLSGVPTFMASVLPIHRSLVKSPDWRRPIPRRLYKAILLSSLPIAGLAFLGQLSAQLETLVLDVVRLGEREIAAYNAAIRPLTALIFLATTFAFGLNPLVSQVFKRVRKDVDLAFLAGIGVRVLGSVALVILGVGWVHAQDLMRIFGPEYMREAYILRIYGCVSLIAFQVVLFDQFLMALGRRTVTLIGGLMQVSLALTLELLVVGRWGLPGLVAAKGLSMIALVGYQLWRVPGNARSAALQGHLRLLATGIALAASLFLTEGVNEFVRGPVIVAVVVTSLILFRVVTREDLRRLRRIRPTV